MVRIEELMPMPPKQLEESEYRRGYADGWIQATEHMHNLVSHRLKSHRLSRLGAYNQCYDYWQRALFDWVRGDCKELVPPPTPPSLPLTGKRTK